MRRKISKLFGEYLPTIFMSELARRSEKWYGKVSFPANLATVLLTNRCNLRCIMCGQWNNVSKDKELSLGDWKKIFASLKKAGFKEIHFTGGEPLLRKEIVDLVSEASGLGLTVGITSNGILLTEELADRLVNAGLYSIAISMDGVDDSYEAIRGLIGGYEKVLRALQIVSRYRVAKKIAAYINFTLMRPSLANFADVKKEADRYGLPVAVCLLDDTPYFFSVKENREKFWIGDAQRKELEDLVAFMAREKKRAPDSLIVTGSALDFILRYFNDTVQRQIPCIVSQTRVFIDPYGKVLGGCLSMGVIGDALASPIESILGSPESRERQKRMFYKKCPGCSCGYLYNIRHHLPSLIKDAINR
jgi:MoaA/NifB/PqqE/SkfB family radical SAM enzyme